MEKRIAFLIGNQKFRPDTDLNPLQGPQNDVAALVPLLGNPDRGNFEVHKFLDKSHYEITHDIAEALDSAAAGDLLLIYYSGHGMLDRGGRLCLATADTRQGDAMMIASSIPARHLSDLVEASDCGQVLLILDCCFSGAVKGMKGDVGDALEVIKQAHGFSIITATTSVQTTREEASEPDGVVMGKFTAALVNGIESGAADHGRKGKILLSDLRRYLGQVVTGSTPRFFDHQASGDPLISLSPETASLVGTRIWHLVDLLEGPFDDERLHAIQQLEAIGGTAGKRAVSALIKAGEANNKPIIREASFKALEKIGPDAAEAVPVLASALNDPDKSVRQSAAKALGKIGRPAVSALIAAVNDPDKSVRQSAANVLGYIGPDAAEAVPVLLDALKDQNENVRQSAAEALGKIGPAAEILPALAAALNDPDKSVRQSAAKALGKIGRPAVSALIASLDDPDKSVRQSAVEALGEIGPDAAEAVPALFAVTELTALNKIGRPAVSALVAALNDANPGLRWHAAYTLGEIGPDAADALPAVIAALNNDPHKTVRSHAASALAKIGSTTEVLPALDAALSDPETDVRESAAKALGKIGPAAVSALEAALKDPDGHVWESAIRSLGEIGPAAVSVLVAGLKHPDAGIRWSAAEALNKIGPPAVPALEAALKDPVKILRQMAATALGRA